jgi:WD40 repeat protein
LGDRGSAERKAARLRRFRGAGPKQPCLLPDRLLHRIPCGPVGCLTLAFSPDGRTLAASCAADGADGRHAHVVRLFDVESGAQTAVLRGHGGLVHRLCWTASATAQARGESRGSARLLSAAADGTARVWRNEAPPRTDRQRTDAEPGADGGAAEAKAGAGSLASAPRMRCAHVLRHAEASFVYDAVPHPVPELELCVTCASDGILRLWKTDSGALLGALGPPGRSPHAPGSVKPPAGGAASLGAATGRAGLTSGARRAVFDGKARKLFSCCGGGVLCVWRIAGDPSKPSAYQVVRKIAGYSGRPILSLERRPTAGEICVLAGGSMLRLHESFSPYRETRELAGVETTDGSPETQCCFSPDGRLVASGSESGDFLLFDADTGHRLRAAAWELGLASGASGVSWSPTEHVVAFSSFGGEHPILVYEHQYVAPSHDGTGSRPPRHQA